MAEMFYFSSPNDAAPRVKYVRLPSRRRCPLGRRKGQRISTRMERPMDLACMARFAEPVFRDNVFFPFSTRPGPILNRELDPADDLYGDDDEAGGVALYGEDQSNSPPGFRSEESQTATDESVRLTSTNLTEASQRRLSHGRLIEAASGVLTLGTGGEFESGRSSEVQLPLRTRHPRPECDEIVQEEDGRRQRFALPGDPPQGLHYFDLPPTGLPPLPRLNYRRSCDSIRSVSSVNALQQTRTSISETSAGFQQDYAFPQGLLENDSDYIVLEDMAQSAWAVDDLRHQNDVLDFCSSWERSDRIAEVHGFAISGSTRSLREALDSRDASGAEVQEVTRQDTRQGMDVQGIRWKSNDLVPDTRDYALQMRALVYPTIFNTSFPDAGIRDALVQKTDTERYYRFRHFSGKQRPKFAHYQLRHLLCSSGRDVFYSTGKKVMRSSLAFPGDERVAMDMTRSALTSLPTQVTSLAVSTDSGYHADSLLLAGGFDGEYAMLDLNSDEPQVEGYVTSARNGVVTHIHTFNSRNSGSLQAAFCSNDLSLRIMDIRTHRFTKTFVYDNSLNCAAAAPDGRLRVLGGDSPEALITDSESGTVQATLRQHSDDIFACAWSPNGRLVATGAQDGKVVIWDSRDWNVPLTTLNSSMTCARSLHFTSDSAALVAAENEDVVRIYDTQDWTSKQDLRFFGTIAGVALVNGGDEIVVGNGDRTMGGLLRWQRMYGRGLDGYDCVTNETIDGSRNQAARRMQRTRRRGMMRNEMVEEVFI